MYCIISYLTGNCNCYTQKMQIQALFNAVFSISGIYLHFYTRTHASFGKFATRLQILHGDEPGSAVDLAHGEGQLRADALHFAALIIVGIHP